MDVTELHDEENLLVQMQDRWEQPRKPFKSSLLLSLKSCVITTIPSSSGSTSTDNK